MSNGAHILGICFSERALYYALRENRPGSPFSYIGKADFSFPVYEVFSESNENLCRHIQKVIRKICDEYHVETARVVTFPHNECWTMLPKLAYDIPGEREAHLRFLAFEIDRNEIETTWFETSNRDFRLLTIRDRNMVKLLGTCTESIPDIELCTEFEVGEAWMKHAGVQGSFMALGCNDQSVTVSSFMLGKLRATTCLRYREIDDISFLWKQNERYLKWMNGYHESILVYGADSSDVVNRLSPFWDEKAGLTRIKKLEDMSVEAGESTYSFSLERAFPAIMMALR